ncbi:MAG: TIGR03986 family CRISPR-associated RAMP protein, partial [Anaerolineales bacterium]
RAIPATSIRGMVRGAFEAVTNSCYAVFDYDKRLSYHLPATDALKLVPGRAEKDAQGRWRLRLLPGSARLAVGERPRDKLYAGRVEQYEAIAPGRRRKRGRYRPPPSKPVALNGLKHGDECFALADDLKFPPVWNVRAVAPHEKDLRVTPGKKQRVLRGYLAITNQNIETKRFERFFFRAPGNTSCPEFAPLTQDVRTKYKELIQDYQDRHADAIRKRKEDGGHPAKTHPARDADGRRVTEAAFSRFIIGGKVELQDGDLVYAMLSGSSQAPRVIFIVPVAIPRVGYERKIAQLLPEHLWKCEEYDELCPACRTFGWVYGQEKGDREDQKQSIPIPENKTTAYAGRVRFSHARQQGKVETFKTSLTILSSPKPTTTRFYLKPSAGPPEDGLDDYRAGYDYRDNVLRGRKFYRHHGHSGDKNYWQDQKCEYRKTGKNSDQNRTVEDALAPGAAFGFSIAFENLSQVELGALLWALQMEGAQYHRLGYGKALGFGSVRLGVEQVTVLDMPARYQTLAETDDDEMPVEKQTEITQQFKDAMRRAYGQSFEALPHVQDLLALLSDPKPDLPIHSPRANQRPDPKGKTSSGL